MPKYVDFVMEKADQLGVGAEGLFSTGEEKEKNKENGSVEIVVKFDKYLNIIGLDMTLHLVTHENGDYSGLYKSTINISKYSQDITPPDWFNQSDFE
ncbi:MAG: hypothetical protein E7345_01555 [Clostridiales bacterium]|nr:hypothetical protein [Clostridiales bacterium]